MLMDDDEAGGPSGQGNAHNRTRRCVGAIGAPPTGHAGFSNEAALRIERQHPQLLGRKGDELGCHQIRNVLWPPAAWPAPAFGCGYTTPQLECGGDDPSGASVQAEVHQHRGREGRDSEDAIVLFQDLTQPADGIGMMPIPVAE